MFFRITAYLLAPFYLAALLWRGRREPGIGGGLAERFGLGAPLPAPVWLHAASVGEVQAAAVLVAALRERDAQLPLLVTTTTAAGLARRARCLRPRELRCATCRWTCPVRYGASCSVCGRGWP